MPTFLPCPQSPIEFQGCFVWAERVPHPCLKSNWSCTSLRLVEGLGQMEPFLSAQLKGSTMFYTRSWKSLLRSAASIAAAFLASLIMLSLCGYGQGVAGRWAATGKTLDNGEIQKAILELTLTGSDLKGK